MKTVSRYTPEWSPVFSRPWRIYDRIKGEHVRDADGKALTFSTTREVYDRIKRLEKTS